MANALADYSQLLEGRDQSKGRSVELFQAALEQIITSQTGSFAMSSCKSTKDRDGSVRMQVDAMMEFYDRHGRLPNYYDNKADQAEFCKIFADIYHSGHNLAQAGLNSNGCDGVKSKQPIDKIRVRNSIAKAGVALGVGLTVFSAGLLPLAAIAIGLVTAGLMTKVMTPPTLLPDDIQQAIGQKTADARAEIADLNKISKDPVIEQIKEQVSVKQAQHEQTQTAELDVGPGPKLPTGPSIRSVSAPSRSSIAIDSASSDQQTEITHTN